MSTSSEDHLTNSLMLLKYSEVVFLQLQLVKTLCKIYCHSTRVVKE